MKLKNTMLATMIMVIVTSSGFAQKGTGNSSGVAKNYSSSIVTELSGELKKIVNEPCKKTTGRYSYGTHLFIETLNTRKRTLNIHVGPTEEIKRITENLKTGQQIEMMVFKTDDLPENQFIVKSLKVKGKLYTLRNEDLKPFWAGNQNHRKRGRGL